MENELTIIKAATLMDRNENDVTISKVVGPYGGPALVYQCKLNVDWDGSAKGYGVDKPGSAIQKNLTGNAHEVGLANAKHKKTHEWVGVFSATEAEAKWALRNDPRYGITEKERLSHLEDFIDRRFPDPNKRFPVVQILDDDPAKGFYVSQALAYADRSKKSWDQRKYLDAALVPYQALSTGMENLGARLHDYGLIIRGSTGQATPFFYGDHAGKGSYKVGECSGYVWTTLGKREDEQHTFIVFPGSGSGIPDFQVPTFMDANVKFRINSLSQAPNSDSLIRFLVTHRATATSSPLTAPQNAEYTMFQSALKSWGW